MTDLSSWFGGSESPRHAPPPAPEPAPEPAPSTPVTARAPLTATDAPQATRDDAASASPTASTEPAAPAPPAVDRAAMDRAAGEIFRAVDGMGTDEDAIHRALRGRSAAEIATLREIYRDHYGRELDGDLEDELSDEDLEQARAAMTADPVDSAVATLVNASAGLGTNEEAIQQTLRGITDPEVRRRVEEQYRERTGESLSTMLADEMGGSDLEVSQLLQDGRMVEADAAALDAAMHETTLGIDFGTDEDRINQVLENVPEAERARLLESYAARTGHSLSTDLRAEMDGPEGDISIALAAGDRAAAAAARMANAADGMGTDEDTIFRQLEGRPEPERRRIIEEFNRRYGGEMGNFEAMLADEMGEMDGERARQLAADGQLDPVFALRYAQDGAGTDEEMLRGALRGRSASEIADIQRRYQEAYGIDLSDEMSGELSGRDEHYIMQMMRGEPATIQERLARAHENYEFERGEGAGLLGGFTDCFYDAGAMLDRQHQRLQGLEARLANAGSDEERQQIEAEMQRVLGYQSQDVEAFHAAQDSVANNTAMAAALIASAAVTIASGGIGGAAVAPLISSLAGSLGMTTGAVTAALAAAAGGAATMATKGLILGDAYGAEAIGTDAAMTVAQMATGGILAGGTFAAQPGQVSQFGQMLASRGINPSGFGGMLLEQSAQGLVGMGVSGTTQALLDENVWRGPGNGVARFAQIMGTSFLQNAGAGIGTGAFNQMTSAPTTFAGAMSHGFVGGAFGGMLQTAVDPSVWSGRWEDVAGRFGVNMAQNGVQTGLLTAWQMQGGTPASQADASPVPQDSAPAVPDAAAPIVAGQPDVAPVVAATPDVVPALTAVPEAAPVVAAAPEVAPVVAQDPNVAPAIVVEPDVAPVLAAHPDAAPVVAAHPEAAPVVAGAPELAPVLADHPELAPVVAAAPELGQALAADPSSPAAEVTARAVADADSEGVTRSRPVADDDAVTPRPDTDAPRMTPEEAFELAKRANGSGSDADLARQVSERLPELLDAQAAARLGENPVLQGQRAAFERAVALSPEAQAAVQPVLDAMCQKALDYINTTRTDPAARAAALESLGKLPDSGLAGAVGRDPATIIAVLESGNPRERALALAGFQTLLGQDALTPGGIDRMRAAFAPDPSAPPPEAGAPARFGADDIDRLAARVEALEAASPDPADRSVKALFGPLDERHAAFADAKGQDMDTKLPRMTPEAVAAQLGQDPPAPGAGLTGKGEANPLARGTMTVAEAREAGFVLSDREVLAAGGEDGVLPWNMGTVANMVDPNAPFIQGARDASMPLKAGVSGTTFRFMGIADALGADPALARLACIAQLIPIDAHSFHEIAFAANGFQGPGSGYDPAAPYSPASMGLPASVLQQIADSIGLGLPGLNQQPPPAPEVNRDTP